MAALAKLIECSMATIEYLEGHVLYTNPKPHVHSRHGCFPGLVQLPSNELLALFVLQEAFEAPNATTCISRSEDFGRTWKLQGPLYDKSTVGYPTSDSMKATVLRDGTLIAIGYRFHRHDPEQSIGIEETGGLLPGDDLISFSNDDGRSWTVPEILPRGYPELLELSGPCVELRSGDLVAVSTPYHLPDGSNPSGPIGVLVRSHDKGRTWDDRQRYIDGRNTITPFEGRIREMQDGRLVAMLWAYDVAKRRHLSNHVVVSHDDGRNWSQPIDTGHMGQSSNLIWLGGDLLATIHAQREGDVGVYVRIVDFSGDRWRPIAESAIWGSHLGQQTKPGQSMAEMFTSLRFGQPSLLQLADGQVLATHWTIEEGQGKVRTHRLRLEI